jgi:predicted DNA-binding transcriptional regulator YafY
MKKNEILETISQAGKSHKVLLIEYRERDGSNDGDRLVEPYSMRDLNSVKEAFFGFDIAKNGIRRFSTERIVRAEITNEVFSPRNGWAVEF